MNATSPQLPMIGSHEGIPSPSAAAPPTANASAMQNLLGACVKMLKLTGGSQYWTGDTQEALELMEAAVAKAVALRIGEEPEALLPAPSAEAPAEASADMWDVSDPSDRSDSAPRVVGPCAALPASPKTLPPTGPCAVPPAIVPPILSSVASSVERGLQMAGAETDRWRS